MRCYKCIKPKDMTANCPLVKIEPDRFKRKKAICATWDETKGQSEEDFDNEDATLCFVAFEEDNNEEDKGCRK